MSPFVNITLEGKTFHLARTDAVFLAEQLAAAIRAPEQCMRLTRTQTGQLAHMAVERTYAMCHHRDDHATDC